MKITKIRRDNQQINLRESETIAEALQNKLANAGYDTEVYTLNNKTIQVGNKRSFAINPAILGYNYKPDMETKQGYKRTRTPDWDQRVEFNNIINQVLDFYKIQANVKSTGFTIRDFNYGAFDEEHWLKQAYGVETLAQVYDFTSGRRIA